MALNDLTGRWVLVTGAASGIGHETALAFAHAGADIIAVDIDEARLSETSRLVEAAGRRCRSFACDVGDAAAVDMRGSASSARSWIRRWRRGSR